MKRNTLILILIALMGVSTLTAQELKVLSFKHMENDLAARTNNVPDINGNPTALIKVMLAIDGAEFNKNQVIEVKHATSQYNVYMPAGTISKKLSISAPGFLPLEIVFKDYGITLEAQNTYELRLEVPQTTGQPRLTTQYVKFTISPKNAEGTVIVEENGKDNRQEKTFSQGYCDVLVSKGTYSYKVYSKDYYPFEGSFTMNPSLQQTEVPIQLVANFGYLQLNPDKSDYAGATVDVDGVTYGTLPMGKIKLAKGSHRVVVRKADYSVFRDSVTILDNAATTQRRVSMDARFRTMQFEVEDADRTTILLDGEVIGEYSSSKPVVKNIGFGNHQIEIRREHHESYITELSVAEPGTQTLTLKAPRPLTGILNITSTPSNADIWLDGIHIGTTPLMYQPLIGTRTVQISKQGYASQTQRVHFSEEGESKVVSVSLNKQTTPVTSTGTAGELSRYTTEGRDKKKTAHHQIETPGFSVSYFSLAMGVGTHVSYEMSALDLGLTYVILRPAVFTWDFAFKFMGNHPVLGDFTTPGTIKALIPDGEYYYNAVEYSNQARWTYMPQLLFNIPLNRDNDKFMYFGGGALISLSKGTEEEERVTNYTASEYASKKGYEYTTAEGLIKMEEDLTANMRKIWFNAELGFRFSLSDVTDMDVYARYADSFTVGVRFTFGWHSL